MQAITVERLAEFAEKGGKLVAALIRERPDLIGEAYLQWFRDTMVFARILDMTPTMLRGSELHEEFLAAKTAALQALETER